jgi:hypothetical protein
MRACVMTQDSHVTYEHNTSKTKRSFIFSCWQPSRGGNNFPLCPNSKYGASCHIKITTCTILIRFAAQLEAPKALDTRFRVRIPFGSTGRAPRFYLTKTNPPSLEVRIHSRYQICNPFFIDKQNILVKNVVTDGEECSYRR